MLTALLARVSALGMRTAVALGATVAVIVTSVVVVVTTGGPALEASDGPIRIGFAHRDEVTDDPLLPIARSGVSALAVTVHNDGVEDSAAEGTVAVEFDLPEGLEFIGPADLDSPAAADGVAPEPGWVCGPPTEPSGSQAGVDAVCRVDLAGGEDPILRAGEALGIVVLVEPRDGGIDGEVVVVRATVPGVDGPGFASTRVIDAGDGAPLVISMASGDSVVMGGQAGSTSISVLNLGSGPTEASDGVAVELTEVMAPGIVSSWAASGDGWACSGPDVGPVSCSSDRAVAVGEYLPELTIAWTAGLFEELAHDSEPLTFDWFTSATANGPSGTVSDPRESQRFMLVLPAPPPVFGAHFTTDESSHVVPGEEVAVDLVVAVPQQGLSAATATLDIHGSLDFVGLDDADCDESSEVVVCVLGDLGEATESTFSLRVAADADAEPGPASVAVSLAADDVEPITDEHEFVIADAGGPAVIGELVTVSGETHTAILDGRDIVTDEDRPARFGVRLHNVGSVALDAGTTVEWRWEQPAGTGRASVTGPDGEACPYSGSAPTVWRCSFDLAESLDLRQSGPVVLVSLTGNRPGSDIDLGTVTTDLDIEGHEPHSRALVLDVTGSSAELRPRLDVLGPLTSGGTGTVAVHLESFGDDSEGAPAFVAVFPEGMSATPADGSGCVADGSQLTCLFDPIAAGATSEVREVPVSVGVAAGVHAVTISAGDLQVDGTVADRSFAEITMDIAVRASVSAEVVAWPSLVVPNAARSSQVVSLVAESRAHDDAVGTTSEWVQRCVDAADVGVVEGCAAVTPELEFLDDVGGRAVRVEVPNPTSAYVYVFEYRHTDGSHTVSDLVTVETEPLGSIESTELEDGIVAMSVPVSAASISSGNGFSFGGGFVLANVSGSFSYGATITGTLENTARGGSWPFTLNYWADDNWSLSIAQGAGSGSFRVFSGWSVPAADIHGSIGENGSGSLNWFLSYSGQQESFTLSNGVAFSSGSFSIQSQCSPNVPIAVTCPDGGGAFVSAGGTVSVSHAWAGNWSASVSMYVGLDGQSAVIAGAVPCCPLPLFSSSNTFIAEYGDVGGDGAGVGGVELAGDSTNQWRVWIQSDWSIPNSGVNGTGYFRLVNGHVVLGASLSGSAGGGSFSGSFVWTNDPNGVQVTAGGLTKQVPTGGQGFSGSYFVGRITAPQWVSHMTGVPNLTLDVFGENGNRGGIDLRAEVQGSVAIPLPGSAVSLAFTDMYVGISRYSDSPATIHVGGQVTLSSRAGGGMGSSSVALDADISADGFGQSISATFSLADQNGWQNAFGVQGLTLKNLIVSFEMFGNAQGWNPPTVGLHATAILPSSVTGPLSISTGTVAMATMVLSETSPCLSIEVGSAGGPTVISLQGGVLDASFFEFTAAPQGCTVGSTRIDPGYSLAFDGHVMGVAVEVGARLTVEPMSFTANVDVGSFQVAGLSFSETRLNIEITPTESRVAFSGGVGFAGSELSVSGSFDRRGGTTTISGTVTLDRIDLGPFALSNTTMTVTVKSGAENSLEIDGRGSFDLMGVNVTVEEFDLVYANGMIERVSFTVDTRLSVSSLTFDGRFSLQYDHTNPSATVVSGSVSATTSEGVRMANGSLTVTPTSAQFSASVDVAPVFTAAVSGSFFHGQPPSGATIVDANGNTVAARAGDFRFAVDHLRLDVAGLYAEGSFAIGNVSGSRFARIAADLRVGSSSNGATLDVVGDLRGDGSFDIRGNGSLTIGGWSGVELAVSAARQSNGSVSVSGSGSIDIRGFNVSVSGSFSNQGGYPSTTLTGSASGSIDGWNFGSMSVTVQQSPSAQGVSASVSISAGPIGASGSISYRQDNGNVLFDASLSGSLNLNVGGFSASVGVDFGNIGGYHFDINGTVSFSGFSWSASWSVNTSGSFGFEKTASNSWSASVGGHGFGAGADGSYTAHVQFNQNGVNAYADVSGDVWGELFGIKASVGMDLSAEFNPFKVCIVFHIAGSHSLCV